MPRCASKQAIDRHEARHNRHRGDQASHPMPAAGHTVRESRTQVALEEHLVAVTQGKPPVERAEEEEDDGNGVLRGPH